MNEKTNQTGVSTASRYEIKSMLEPQGTTFGIYKDGKLFQYGFLTKNAAQDWINIRTGEGSAPRVRLHNLSHDAAWKGDRWEDVAMKLSHQVGEQTNKLMACEAQRDELLAAGKALRDWCDANLNGAPLDYSKIIASLDAAIAKTEVAQ